MANKNPVGGKASAPSLGACQACAKRRTRCDQQQPCHRCKRIKIECIRKQPVRLSKSQLRQEKARLQTRHKAASAIFDTLASGKRSDEIIELLRQKQPVQQIANQLVANYDYDIDGSGNGSNSVNQQGDPTAPTHSQSSPVQATFAWSPGESTLASPFELRPEHAPVSDYLEHVPDVVPVESRSESQQTLETPSDSSYSRFLSGDQHSVSTTATSVSTLDRHSALPSPTTEQIPNDEFSANDAFAFMKLVLDLTDAFFTWHAAPFPAIQRSQFISDFLRQQTEHCSPALIRIISCLGCRALGGYDTNHSTYASLGNRLFEESRMLLAHAPAYVPDVHACGLLALHQLGIGQYGDAAELAEEGVKRMASMMESEGSLGAETSEPLKYNSALCSVIALAQFVRLMLGYLTEHDPLMASPLVLGPSQESDDGLEALICLRGPLPADSSYLDVPSSPLLAYSLIDLVYRYFATVRSSKSDIAPQANHLDNTYRKCLLWCDTALSLDRQQSELCPFMHMLYHFCLLVLWRQFCQIPLVTGSITTAVCAESAGAILSLAGSSPVRDHRAPNQFFLAHLFVLAASLPGVTTGAL